jgi:ribosome-associated heat shock protein Hsp15
MSDTSIRLDKWLWAARFFKTRALAAEAIGGGHVEVNGEKVKRARGVREGDEVRVRLGAYVHHVVVKGLSDRRGPAAQAALLYEETPESRAARARLAEQHRAAAVSFSHHQGKPGKHERRALEKLRRSLED